MSTSRSEVCYLQEPIVMFQHMLCQSSRRQHIWIVSIIQTYRPWTPRRTSGRIINKKIWRESEAYRNFGKRFDWSLAIKRHIVMSAPIVETIWLVNGFKRHIVMTAPLAVTVPSSVHNLMKNSSRRFVGKSRSLMIETRQFTHCIYNSGSYRCLQMFLGKT